jgi:NADH-quinone oxidoreductase subunit L
MLGLVLANNLLVIYMFWEGVGLGSYLLIGFWYNRRHQTGSFINRAGREVPIISGPAPAAMKAFVTTRLGDFGFLLGILWLWWHADTLEFTRLIEMAESGALTSGILSVGCILLFIGAVGKSAQFPLHVWLPDAMEGPTPVSALIHAATMVAAGVYLVGRTFPLFEHAPAAMLTVAFIGGFTAIFAASMGLVSTDIKRVMAFSTVSQLGYMMLAMGAYNVAAGSFHLFTHAFFKALLFLTAGSVIYALHRAGAPHVGYVTNADGSRAQVVPAQDLRTMGGLFSRMPITAWTMIIAALSLAGIPPLSGFWSKDEVLLYTMKAAQSYGGIYWVLLGFALITVFMTAFYMFRVIFLTFGGTWRGSMDVQYVRESPLTMTLPLLILAVPSILVGLWGAPQLGNGFGQFLEGEAFHGTEMNYGLAALGTVLALGGIGLAWAMYSARMISPVALANRFRPIYVMLFNRYWFDELYAWILDRFVVSVAMGMSWFDRNVVDGVVNGVGKGTTVAGDWLRGLQTGRIPSYALAVAGGLVIIAFWAVFFSDRVGIR